MSRRRAAGLTIAGMMLGALIVFAAMQSSERNAADPNESAKQVLKLREPHDNAILARFKSPEFGWKVERDETVSMEPGSLKAWTMPPDEKDLQVQLTVEASQPVTFGFAAADSIAELTSRDLPSFSFEEGSPCLSTGALRTTVSCEVPRVEAVSLAIKDERGPTSVARGVLGIFARNPQMVSSAAAPNTVRIVWRIWDCIANCSY